MRDTVECNTEGADGFLSHLTHFSAFRVVLEHVYLAQFYAIQRCKRTIFLHLSLDVSLIRFLAKVLVGIVKWQGTGSKNREKVVLYF